MLVKNHVTHIVHCGDWTKADTLQTVTNFALKHKITLFGVLGNRDDDNQLAATIAELRSGLHLPPGQELYRLAIDGRRIIVYHGHHKPTLRRLIQEDYDVLLTGHTHKPLIQTEQTKLIINPGSTAFSIPRRKEPRSFALYDTNHHHAELVYFSPV
jgi:hypothetical protein